LRQLAAKSRTLIGSDLDANGIGIELARGNELRHVRSPGRRDHRAFHSFAGPPTSKLYECDSDLSEQTEVHKVRGQESISKARIKRTTQKINASNNKKTIHGDLKYTKPQPDLKGEKDCGSQ